MAVEPRPEFKWQEVLELETDTVVDGHDYETSGASILIRPERDSVDAFSLPFELAKGLAKGIGHFRRSGGSQAVRSWPHRHIEHMKIGGEMRPALQTDAHPEFLDSGEVPRRTYIFVGLTEINEGSANLLHRAEVLAHPDTSVTTVMTPGISSHGPTLPFWQGLTRSLELTAEEYHEAILDHAGDDNVRLIGTSLGSLIGAKLALRNMSVHPEHELNLRSLGFISPAVGAKGIHEDIDDWTGPDVDDKLFIQRLTARFFAHMPADITRMAALYPETVAMCSSALMVYASQPTKYHTRLATLVGNVLGAQQGMEWDELKAVATEYPTRIIAGQDDPLWKVQRAQFEQLLKSTSSHLANIMIGTVIDRGHALSLDAKGTIAQLDGLSKLHPLLA
ncbi:MAG TPA: alpha/beta hydrolase [Candidatus Sulfotelmatobacter sp.]|nr:alpha/beta hydrolase [Candidatus Sulfotelmatobacter sp.]